MPIKQKQLILSNSCKVIFSAPWVEASKKNEQGQYEDRTYQGTLLINRVYVDLAAINAVTTSEDGQNKSNARTYTQKVLQTTIGDKPIEENAIAQLSCQKTNAINDAKREDIVASDILVGDIQRNLGGANGVNTIKIYSGDYNSLNKASQDSGRKSFKFKKVFKKQNVKERKHTIPR